MQAIADGATNDGAQQQEAARPPASILVCGIDDRERRRLRRALAAHFTDTAIIGEHELELSALKGIKLRLPKVDLVLLVHFSEGRVLLTDKVSVLHRCCSSMTDHKVAGSEDDS